MVSENPDHHRRVVATDVGAVYENGVLRPDRALDLPDHARVRVSVSDEVNPSKLSPEEWVREFRRVREAFKINTKGWTFNRDEIHERD